MADDLDFEITDTRELAKVLKEMPVVSTFWQDLGYPSVHVSEKRKIDFAKIGSRRQVAPLVVPTLQGVPMYNQAETVSSFEPAYYKPKDPIIASELTSVRVAGMGELLSSEPLSNAQRMDIRRGEILLTHSNGIKTGWEVQAADGLLDGKIRLENAGKYPLSDIDFKRNPDHTIQLTDGLYWGDDGVLPMRNLQQWIYRVGKAKFSGPVRRIVIGVDAWEILSRDKDFLDKLDTRINQTQQMVFNRGVVNYAGATFLGKWNSQIDMYLYNDYYEDDDGTEIPFMDSRDVLLIGSNTQGVRCFGAIADFKARLAAVQMFACEWLEHDPSGLMLMTQSAPLMVVVNPNNTLRARVIKDKIFD